MAVKILMKPSLKKCGGCGGGRSISDKRQYVCLFVLRLNVPVNNFSVMSGQSQLFLGLTSTVGS